MWFKNLQLYRLNKALAATPEQLHEMLQGRTFTGCSRMEMTASGWAPPLGRHGEMLTHAANGFVMICHRKEDKIIPAGVVRQMVEDRAAEIEAAEFRDVRRRERQRLKDAIIDELLPHALSRITDTFAYLDTRNNMLVIDASTPAKAADFVSQMVKTSDDLNATAIKVRQSPMAMMTGWLQGQQLPADFELGEECELKHSEPDGGIISCKHQDLYAGEVQNHVANGKFAARLAMIWKERLSFVLHDDLSIKRLRFENVIKESAEDVEADDVASRFDLDFTLMTLELAAFAPIVLDMLGGEDREQAPANKVTEKPELVAV